MRLDPLDLLARFRRGEAGATELIGWATDALVDGRDSLSLRLLAGLVPVDLDSAESLFRAALKDLDIEVPGPWDLAVRYLRSCGVDESPLAGTVMMGRTVFEGWIDDIECDRCGSPRLYHAVYDSYFCPLCGVWLERRCPDPECESCSARPPAPPRVEGDTG